MKESKNIEKDWASLDRKIASGKTLEQAALEAGVTIQEAQSYLAERRVNAPFDDDSLRLVAAEALHHGVAKLIAAAQAGPRTASEKVETGATAYESSDIDAAKALVRFALDAKKLIKGTSVTAKKEQKDLFDIADKGPWKLKD